MKGLVLEHTMASKSLKRDVIDGFDNSIAERRLQQLCDASKYTPLVCCQLNSTILQAGSLASRVWWSGSPRFYNSNLKVCTSVMFCSVFRAV